MICRRTLLGAAAGALAFPVPALARSSIAAVHVTQRQILSGRASEPYAVSAAQPVLTRHLGGIAAFWLTLSPRYHYPYLAAQSLGATLDPRSAVTAIAPCFLQRPGVAFTKRGGLAVLHGEGIVAMAVSKVLGGAGEYRTIASDDDGPAQLPRVTALSGGTFAVCWAQRMQAATVNDVRAAVVDPEGRVVGRPATVFDGVANPEKQVFPLGIFPAPDGAMLVLWTSVDGKREFHIRRMSLDGSLGEAVQIAPRMDQTDLLTDDQPFAVLSGGMIAGSWCEDGVWTGGVFAPDGARLATFEPASVVGSFGGRQILVPLSGNRILSTRTGAVHDARTGRFLGALDVGRQSYGDIVDAVMVGGDQLVTASVDRRGETAGLDLFTLS